MIVQNDPPKARILVVDDDRDAADTTAILLEMDGYEARTAADGVEAVERISSYCPDIVLLDLAIPRLNGYGVARTVRERALPQQPILVAVTGYADKATRLKCAEADFDLHVSKLFDFSLFGELSLLLRESAQLRERFAEPKAVQCARFRALMRMQIQMANTFLEVAATTCDPAWRKRCLGKAQVAAGQVERWLRQMPSEEHDQLYSFLGEFQHRYHSVISTLL